MKYEYYVSYLGNKGIDLTIGSKTICSNKKINKNEDITDLRKFISDVENFKFDSTVILSWKLLETKVQDELDPTYTELLD